MDECSSSPCQNGGFCGDQVGGFVCVCVVGYTGSLCEQDIDECASSPCVNQAQCKDTVSGYVCRCQAGYRGTHCETGE